MPPVLPPPAVRAPNPLLLIRPYPDGVRNEAGSGRHSVNLTQIVLKISCRGGRRVSRCYELLFRLGKRVPICTRVCVCYICVYVYRKRTVPSLSTEERGWKEGMRGKENKERRKGKEGRKGKEVLQQETGNIEHL